MSAACRCSHPVEQVEVNAVGDHAECGHIGGGRSDGRLDSRAPCVATWVHAHPGCLAPKVAAMRREHGYP